MPSPRSRRILWFGLALAAFCQAAPPAPADPRWETDYEKAVAQAKQEGKFLLLDFTGSDWCGWCVKLDDQVFSRSEFKKYADRNLVCVTLDFPHAKKQSAAITRQNQALAKQFGVGGYPTIILLKPTGEEIGRTGYRDGGPAPYVEHLETMLKPHREQVSSPSAATGASADAPRVWTDLRGRTIQGALKSRAGSEIVLLTDAGQEIAVPVSSLCAGDRLYLSRLRN